MLRDFFAQYTSGFKSNLNAKFYRKSSSCLPLTSSTQSDSSYIFPYPVPALLTHVPSLIATRLLITRAWKTILNNFKASGMSAVLRFMVFGTPLLWIGFANTWTVGPCIAALRGFDATAAGTNMFWHFHANDGEKTYSRHT